MIKKKAAKTRGSRDRPLNDREVIFCRAIVTGSSKIDALRNAGFRSKNKNTLYTAAVRMYKKARIQAFLRELRLAIAQKYNLTEENIFRHTGSIATSDIRDFVKWGPRGVTLKGSEELTESQALAVEEVSETSTKDGGTVKFKLHSKTKGIELGAKLLGLLVDKKEITGKDGQKLIIEIVKFAE